MVRGVLCWFARELFEGGRDGYGMCRGSGVKVDWPCANGYTCGVPATGVLLGITLLGILTLVLFATFIHGFLCFRSLASLY
jgi:hypothetical protein